MIWKLATLPFRFLHAAIMELKGWKMTARPTKHREDGSVAEAEITSEGLTIVFRRIDFYSWEPLYAKRANGEIVGLPACFSPNAQTIRTLEGACGKGA